MSVSVFEIYGNRYYYQFDDLMNLHYGASATTKANKLLPEADFVKMKQNEMGVKEFKAWFAKKADFGTVFHILVKTYIEQKELLHSDIIDLMKSYYVDPAEAGRMIKGLLSVITFIKDYDIEFTFTEKTFLDLNSKTGGTIDAYGFSRKLEQNLLIDWKSGNYTTMPLNYDLQLSIYKNILTREGFEVDRALLVCPKDWRTKPSYNVLECVEVLDYETEMQRYDRLFRDADVKLFFGDKYSVPANGSLTIDTIDNLTTYKTTLAKELLIKHQSASELYGNGKSDII